MHCSETFLAVSMMLFQCKSTPNPTHLCCLLLIPQTFLGMCNVDQLFSDSKMCHFTRMFPDVTHEAGTCDPSGHDMFQRSHRWLITAIDDTAQQWWTPVFLISTDLWKSPSQWKSLDPTAGGQMPAAHQEEKRGALLQIILSVTVHWKLFYLYHF